MKKKNNLKELVVSAIGPTQGVYIKPFNQPLPIQQRIQNPPQEQKMDTQLLPINLQKDNQIVPINMARLPLFPNSYYDWQYKKTMRKGQWHWSTEQGLQRWHSGLTQFHLLTHWHNRNRTYMDFWWKNFPTQPRQRLSKFNGNNCSAPNWSPTPTELCQWTAVRGSIIIHYPTTLYYSLLSRAITIYSSGQQKKNQ